MKTIGIGIVGTGFAERVQLPALRNVADARVVAVTSGHRANAERAAARFDIPHVSASVDDLVKIDDVDLVVISSPPHTHEPAALAALSAGKHVLCEKPMALDAAEARRMVAAAETAGVLNLVDHELRFGANRRKAKDLIESGYVGDVRHVSATYRANFGLGRKFNWWYRTATGGGVLGAIGSHVVDTLRWWFGECVRVNGQLRTFIPTRPDVETGEPRQVEADDFVAFWMEMASGALVEVSLSSIATGRLDHSIEVIGSHGSLLLDDERMKLTGWRNGVEEDLSTPDPACNVEGILQNAWSPAFLNFAREIVAALRDGRTDVPGAATFADGARVQSILDAIRTSSASGASVAV